MTVLSAGETFEVSSTRFRMGIGWDKDAGAGVARTGRPEVDLDATALEFTGSQLFDLAFYNNLSTRDGSVVHQGDNQTGSGEGDDESILVDLSKVHGPVDTILFLVSSYQGHSLEWVANAYCRLVDEESDEELARFTLTFSVHETGAVLALLRRSPQLSATTGWVLHAVGEGVPITVPTQGLGKLTRFVS
jgi:tellurium resistance protein TerZ